MSLAKPADERAGHHAAPEVVGAPQRELVAPVVPWWLELPEHLVTMWGEVWTSPMAQVLDPSSDLQPMARLFELYALDQSVGRATRNHVKSLERMGEYVLDPEAPAFDPALVRARLAVASEVRQLEQTLGISPRGRLVIGAAVLAAGRAAGEIEGGQDDADD